MELAKSDWATIRKSPPWAIDSWGLGKSFIWYGIIFVFFFGFHKNARNYVINKKDQYFVVPLVIILNIISCFFMLMRFM